jgi:hypothetical protein
MSACEPATRQVLPCSLTIAFTCAASSASFGLYQMTTAPCCERRPREPRVRPGTRTGSGLLGENPMWAGVCCIRKAGRAPLTLLRQQSLGVWELGSGGLAVWPWVLGQVPCRQRAVERWKVR